MIRTLRRYIATDGNDNKEYIYIACLSTDTKPTTGIITGSAAIEVDTGKRYEFNEVAGEWVEQPASGGGGGSGLPPVETTDYGKYLRADPDTGEVEWSDVEGGGAFVVTITETESSGSYSYTSDKTYNEINDAVTAGKQVETVLKLSGGKSYRFAAENGIVGGDWDSRWQAKTPVLSDSTYYLIEVYPWGSVSVQKEQYTATHLKKYNVQISIPSLSATIDGYNPTTDLSRIREIPDNVECNITIYQSNPGVVYDGISTGKLMNREVPGWSDDCNVRGSIIYLKGSEVHMAKVYIDFLNESNNTFDDYTITSTPTT